MRVLGRLLGWLFAIVLAVLVGGYFFLQDANRLKPELQTLIEENTDYQATLGGDVRWQLFPPLQLKMQDVTLTKDDEVITAANLDLKMDLSAMWEDTDQWRVTALKLNDAQYQAEGAVTNVPSLQIFDFRINTPAKFSLQIGQIAEGAEAPTEIGLDGTLTYAPGSMQRGQRITFADTHVVTEYGHGVCNADITEVANPTQRTTATPDDEILPLSTLDQFDLSAQCNMAELTYEGETFTNAQLDITHVAGQLNVLLNVPEFLGGSLIADVDVDTLQTPITWTVLPEIDNVDSQRLLDWTDRHMQWIASIAFNSTISMQGNTPQALANSVSASSDFDGGQGQLNIAKIKQQLMRIALLTQRADEVNAWPDVWDYQEFVGRWQINGPVHDLKFALDNMSVDANGTYDYTNDVIDMLANVTINEGENSPFRINPMLEGTPIPVRCAGPAEDPQCKLDDNAAKSLVAKALQRGDDSGLRRKLEDKIDEKVPEEYRETARELLDILGRALDRD